MPPQETLPGNLTESELAAGYWYVGHAIALRRIAIIVLATLATGLISFSIWRVVAMYVLEREADAKIEYDLTHSYLSPGLHDRLVPSPLVVSTPQVLSGKDAYDFVAQLGNSNKNLYAKFKYRFVTGDFATEYKEGFILPGEQKYIAALAVKAPIRPDGAIIEIENLAWTRVSVRVIPEYEKFAAEHLAFRISDVAYTPVVDLGKGTVGKTNFSVTNDTGYAYYQVRFVVVAQRPNSIGGVTITTVSNLRPGETRPVEATWFDALPAIANVEVYPEVDIFDQSAYLPAQ